MGKAQSFPPNCPHPGPSRPFGPAPRPNTPARIPLACSSPPPPTAHPSVPLPRGLPGPALLAHPSPTLPQPSKPLAAQRPKPYRARLAACAGRAASAVAATARGTRVSGGLLQPSTRAGRPRRSHLQSAPRGTRRALAHVRGSAARPAWAPPTSSYCAHLLFLFPTAFAPLYTLRHSPTTSSNPPFAPTLSYPSVCTSSTLPSFISPIASTPDAPKPSPSPHLAILDACSELAFETAAPESVPPFVTAVSLRPYSLLPFPFILFPRRGLTRPQCSLPALRGLAWPRHSWPGAQPAAGWPFVSTCAARDRCAACPGTSVCARPRRESLAAGTVVTARSLWMSSSFVARRTCCPST
jgi:hypothetical protein